MSGDYEPVTRAELEALLATRKDLGAQYDDALVDSFADRIEQAIELRTRQVLGARARERGAGEGQFWLGVISLGAGIPISGIAGGIAELPGLIAAWTGIVGVNVAHAIGARRRRG